MNKVIDFKKGAASKWIMLGFAMPFLALLATLTLVVFSDSVAMWSGERLGVGSNKIEIIRLIGWAMSGVFVVIGLVVLNRRADAQMSAAEAQIENNRLVERGHKQERFKTATEHLGHDKSSVRIAAFYEFLHLVKGNEKENGKEYRKSILDILYAHIRTITDDFARREDVKDAEEKGEPIKLTEEIQGLLDILFKSQDIDRSDIKPNLQRVYFSGADLLRGDLSGADLSKANLSKAFLQEANLSGAKLHETDLSGANLSRTIFFIADFSGALLYGTNLSKADLSGVDLSGVDFPGVDLSEANLSRANLSGADLSEAGLSSAQLGKAIYTNQTIFPKWFEPPIIPPDNGDEVQFPEDFVMPEKSDDDE